MKHFLRLDEQRTARFYHPVPNSRLAVIYAIPLVNTGKAYGIGWLNEKGLVLTGVGVLYLAFGLMLPREHVP